MPSAWLYLAVVLGLFSHQVIGWSMKPSMFSDLAIGAKLMTSVPLSVLSPRR
ncbi:Integrase, catalytic region [Pseudomonas ficuserectae]|nr:Integrase, catalytic region [Pseudomonas ficuserectae]RMS34564.1 Integrase, catalytic region [Pseudomonas ficuserectae]RMS36055.1 Integrase, catalytic region [Pseudomonas ficuserectae]